MSFLDYMFDTEYRQRRDINADRDRLTDLQSNMYGVGEDVHQLRLTVQQLSATVRVLVRVLADAKLLDATQLKTLVAEEVRHPKDAQAEGPAVHCVRCMKTGPASEMVRVGADYLCRPCARNP